MEETTPGVRESRRRAALARSIAEQFTGPRVQLEELSRKSPFIALAIGLSAGVVLGLLVRGKR